MIVNPSAMKWQCGRCNHWNTIENGKCAQCSALSQQFATAFRLHNVLTAEESNFYKGTAPQILREIREVRVLLERLNKTKEDQQVEEGKAKELLDQIWDIEGKITKMMNENRGARMDKAKPVHDYGLIGKMQQEKEELITERRELIIGQSTTQQENTAKGFTVTDGSGGQEVRGVQEGLAGNDKVQEVLGKEEVPEQAPPKDGRVLTENEQIIKAIKEGNVAEIMQKQAVAPENVIPVVRPVTKRTNKATAREELAAHLITLIDLIEKYFRQ